MRDIRRSDAFEPLVERLTGAKLTNSGAPVFSTIMDLLIFAAAVGFHAKRRISVQANGRGIPYRIFENNQKEGHLFLMALAEAKDSVCLVLENDDEIAKVFEEYAAGGLEITSSWLNESPSDISGVQTLLSKIQTELGASIMPTPDPSPI